MKHILPVLVLALFAGVLACGGDDSVTPPPPPERPTFQDRSEKWHVLNNIELAYNQRKISYYDALLDESFTFFLTDKDVLGGLPDSWGRAMEVQANTNLFSKEPPEGLPRCKSILMDIQWEDNLSWQEVSAPIADETWYLAQLYVDFEISVDPDLTLVSNVGNKAEFVIRNGGTVSQPRWQLVEMRDLGAPSGPSTTAMATEPETWGHIKAMYLN